MSAGTILENPQPKTQDEKSTSPPEIESLNLAHYGTVLSDLHKRYLKGIRSSLRHAIRAGRVLYRLRREFKYGDWLPFLRDFLDGHCNFKERMAYYYMAMYRNRKKLGSLQYVADLKTAIEYLEGREKDDKNGDENDGDGDKFRNWAKALEKVLLRINGLLDKLEKSAYGKKVWSRKELEGVRRDFNGLSYRLENIEEMAKGG